MAHRVVSSHCCLSQPRNSGQKAKAHPRCCNGLIMTQYLFTSLLKRKSICSIKCLLDILSYLPSYCDLGTTEPFTVTKQPQSEWTLHVFLGDSWAFLRQLIEKPLVPLLLDTFFDFLVQKWPFHCLNTPTVSVVWSMQIGLWCIPAISKQCWPITMIVKKLSRTFLVIIPWIRVHWHLFFSVSA